MRIVYFASFFTTDSDFPLIKELQRRNVDVVYCLMASRYGKRAGLINLKQKMKTGIYKASELDDFSLYKEYIDLDRIYVFYNDSIRGRGLKSLFFHIKVFRFLKNLNADIIHFAWFQRFHAKIFYFLNLKKCLTVHDPLEHSSNRDPSVEKDRKFAFKKMDKLILLNNVQLEEFKNHYHIDESYIVLNKMGYFDYLPQISHKRRFSSTPYVLFFGYIREYKGLEYLCKAMKIVHLKHPEVKLLIAGGGELYFDWQQYANLDYIVLYNKFIDLPDLACFLKFCEFSICPYKDATQSGVVQTAFSLDVPMIVTNVGALPEVVINNENGLVVPPCDVDALANSIADLLDNPQKLSLMKNNIKNKWQNEMSWKPIVDKYIECYNSLVSYEQYKI